MATQIDRSQAVTNLQKYLRRVSFGIPDVIPPPIDGIFDTSTRDALASFQRRVGLPDTGIADKNTHDALFSEYLRTTENERASQGLFLFPKSPSDYEITLGDTLTLVRIIQLLLLELRVAYDVFEDVVESGTYDITTQNAIRDFQVINGLTPTGNVDEATWNRIVREYTNLALREEV